MVKERSRVNLDSRCSNSWVSGYHELELELVEIWILRTDIFGSLEGMEDWSLCAEGSQKQDLDVTEGSMYKRSLV